MIEIIENIISKDLQDYLEKIAITEMPYFYYENISGYEGEIYDTRFFRTGGFSHVAYRDGKSNSIYYEEQLGLKHLVNDIAEKFNVKIKELLRIKLSITTPVPGYRSENFNGPHVDLPTPHHVLLYYINDSDGDTIFFETPTDLSKEDLKIIRRITPKKGTCVLFDGSIYHTQSNPITSQLRVNMNVNVILED
jgi:hypothetical protein